MIITEKRITTNLLLMDDLNFWETFNVKKLFDDEASYFEKIIENINKQLNKTIEFLNNGEAVTYYADEGKYRREIFNALDDEINKILSNDSEDFDKYMEDFFKEGLIKGFKDINRRIHFSESTRSALNFVKEYNFNLIKNLSNDLMNQVKHAIWKGIGEGQSVEQIANVLQDAGLQRLPGSSLTAHQRAVMIARTETGRAQTTGTLQAYNEYGVEKIEIITAPGACIICLQNAYNYNDKDDIIFENHGKIKYYNIKDAKGLVPAHPNCVCTVSAVIEHDLPENPLNNPQIANLTPLNIDEKEVQKKLEKIIDKEDLENVSKGIVEFKKGTYNLDYENLSIWDNEFNSISKFHTSNAEESVTIPQDVMKLGREKGLFLSIHNHPSMRSPLPSSADINILAYTQTKYGITSTNHGIIIMKNNNITDNAGILNTTKINKATNQIQHKISNDYSKSKDGSKYIDEIKDKITNNKITGEEGRNLIEKDFHKFLLNNNEKYVKYIDKRLSKFDINVKYVEI